MLKIKVSTKITEGGRRISKPISVVVNDPKNRKLQLRITGDVKSFVSIEPQRVIFSGSVGEQIKREVRIVPRAEESFGIKRIRAMRGTDISFRLENSQKDGKESYIVHVENTRETPGRYYDKIYVETDNDIIGDIILIVSGNIRPEIKTGQ